MSPAEHDPLHQMRLSPVALRMLAHPLRSRLLSQLRTRGEATATRLAADLGTHTGATSYHLRRLAEAGLVVDTGTGDGRRRVWAPASELPSWSPSDVADDEDAATTLTWLERDYLRHLGEHTERWLDVSSTWPVAWQDAMGVDDLGVLVTPAQAEAMRAEIRAVLERYRRAGQGNPSARRVSAWYVAYPVDLDSPPRGTTS